MVTEVLKVLKVEVSPRDVVGGREVVTESGAVVVKEVDTAEVVDDEADTELKEVELEVTEEEKGREVVGTDIGTVVV